MRSFLITLNVISVLFLFERNVASQEKCTITGSVINADNNQPASYCTVQLLNSTMGSLCDSQGGFYMHLRCDQKVSLRFSCLSFQPLDTTFVVSKNQHLQIQLKPISLSLEDINVIAKVNENISSSSIIGQEAITQIQPSGLSEIIQLIPGNLIKDGDLEQPNYVAIRQVGTDENTSLGTSIILDGIPINDDANLQRPYTTDLFMDKYVPTGFGLDLRQISPDEIENVEVITGIPSVKYGELTSGAIIINRKIGVGKWQARVKTDIKNKLIGISKGFQLPKNLGTLNIGLDYLKFVSDPRSPLKNYGRITSSLRHQKAFEIQNKQLITRTSVSFVNTINKEKADGEVDNQKNDIYKADYKKIDFSLITDYHINGWIDKINTSFSVSYTHDELIRNKLVSLGGELPLPISMEEGVAKAIYLPHQYQSNVYIDGKPISIYAGVEINKRLNTGKLDHKLIVGGNYRYQKNKGTGDNYDITKPPYHANVHVSARPRNFNSLPSLQKMFLYAEDEVTFGFGKFGFKHQFGLRTSQVLHLEKDYYLNEKIHIDPRINTKVLLPEIQINNHPLQITIGGGYGKHTKLPVMHDLFKYPFYIDIIELNYFSQNPDLRTIYTRTYIEDAINYQLKASRNTKKEISLGMDWNGFKIRATLFHEINKTGYTTNRNFIVKEFNKYDNESVPSDNLTAPPNLEDFTYIPSKDFYGLDLRQNGRLVIKEGIEYDLILPKIEALKTKVSINGAWLKTDYGNLLFTQYHPQISVQNKNYEFVGVYKGEKRRLERFNSNLRFDTHIPSLKLICSLQGQFIWFKNEQDVKLSQFPDYYFDVEGIQYDYKLEDAEDYKLRYLKKPYRSVNYKKEKIPVSVDLNFKLTKEIGDKLNLAFFINRFLVYYKPFTSKRGNYVKRQVDESKYGPKSPYFGAELKVKF